MVNQSLELVMITKQKIVSLIDLTQLGDNDTQADIISLCAKARNPLGEVAAICVYKQFIPIVKKQLGNNFKVATVVNFPNGENTIEDVVTEVKQALSLGANEIDLVIDYKEYLEQGFSEKSCQMMVEVKKLCKDKTLKVIIESGELKLQSLIAKVCQDVIEAGADFIKTSTGKTSEGATLTAAELILNTIKHGGKKIGFKASGGIRNYSQAVAYTKLAANILSNNFVNPQTFRFGVSGLLDNLLNEQQEQIDGY
ncbi:MULTISPECIES: deoxyribose-phosphate aldolase [Francisella]|uniref:Deoxyribose-phosphate aldolase n=1 Tax=Francisella opportunistica TaxID=2016517 RepID=A0A345JT54_9GAMM|nr:MULTISPECIES: deoxyribose-phosphate aldolase [Francisella]AXH30500.1 deoxyribose-phosphate aldolase [Francisella opportunistica]AXH32141.1 deoxyribose-phosphate aldolase [Francisella opportunistica]AXH33790.1 deoxyribose-phosphate aldolase [Francisella opportunistica]